MHELIVHVRDYSLHRQVLERFNADGIVQGNISLR